MTSVCCYFQVHQPYRLRRDFDFFAIGSKQPVQDDAKNREILAKVAEKCYLPANALLLELLQQHPELKLAFSLSGVVLEQLEQWAPEVLDSFRKLVATGRVELIAETYYHSLAFLFSEKEWRRQVRLHQKTIKRLFGVETKTFRNTELIYNDALARAAEGLGFKTVLAEGADRVLGWRSPNYVYRPAGTKKIKLLLKNYGLSDDVAFRFSNKEWTEYPLSADKYAAWLQKAGEHGQTINLFMDYETFGEHQWEESGIFDFLAHLPAEVLKRGMDFATPAEVSKRYDAVGDLAVPNVTSWADTERDVSAWLGNPMQDAAAASVYDMEKAVAQTRDPKLLELWSRLQTSDHYYYMCTKWFQDGDVHKYFNPYESPYDAFIFHANAQNELRFLLQEHQRVSREKRRTVAREKRRPRGAAKGTGAPVHAPAPMAAKGGGGRDGGRPSNVVPMRDAIIH